MQRYERYDPQILVDSSFEMWEMLPRGDAVTLLVHSHCRDTKTRRGWEQVVTQYAVPKGGRARC